MNSESIVILPTKSGDLNLERDIEGVRYELNTIREANFELAKE